jgi:hypothetical protein
MCVPDDGLKAETCIINIRRIDTEAMTTEINTTGS